MNIYNCPFNIFYQLNTFMRKVKLSLGMLMMSIAIICASLSCSPEEVEPMASKDGEATASAGSMYAEVTLSGSTWRAVNNGTTVYSGSDMFAAVNAAIGSLPSRTSKGTVRIKNSGSSGSSGGSLKSINIENNTILDFGGVTINANSGDNLIVPINGIRKSNIEIRGLRVTGLVRYGIWLQGCTNIIISNTTMSLSGGLGIRVDTVPPFTYVFEASSRKIP